MKKSIEEIEAQGKQIDDLEMDAFRGRINRRTFITRLLQLGVSVSAAGAMASRAHAAVSSRMPLVGNYDYIIVGSGSAGCILANRISACGASVLLVEAGIDQLDQPKIAIGDNWVDNLGSDTDWAYAMANQTELNNRSLSGNAGKTVGGSGSINAMFWLRGDLRDYLRWYQLVGQNWAPSRILAALNRIENYLPGNDPHRSQQGLINVGRYASANPITDASIAAAVELGLPAVDHNASALIDGAGVADLNMLPDGRRSGPAQAYLLPALLRSNISLLENARVSGLMMNGNRCRGISAVVDNQVRNFTATREVILCAGAIGSPRLMMTSGIGPAAMLNAAGVQVRHDLPRVGENLHDHMILTGINFTAGPEFNPMPTLGRVASHAFFRTNPIHQAPDIQMTVMQTPFPPNVLPAGTGFTILPWVAKPLSRGRVTLTGSDPFAPLFIDPGYLSDQQDRQTLLTGLDYAIAMGTSQSMAPFAGSLTAPASGLQTTADKLAFIRQYASNGLHLSGTCAAGKNPNNSVVDDQFRVWGLNGLRVVDASVLPEVPGVNPQAAILALAELAAETLGCAPQLAECNDHRLATSVPGYALS